MNGNDLKLILKFFIGLVLIQWLVGCGHFYESGKQEILSIDSNPRGVMTYSKYNGKKIEIGRTPFFWRSERSFTKNIYFKSVDAYKKKKIRCGFRWFEVVIPDTVLGVLLGGGVGGAGIYIAGPVIVGYEAFNGRLFKCTPYVKVRLPEEAGSQEAHCGRYMIIPPVHEDEMFSDLMAKEWLKANLERKDDCVDFFDFNKSKEFFSFLNINYKRDVRFNKIRQKKLFDFGYHNNVSHLVKLKAQKTKSGKVLIVPKIYDIHSKKILPKQKKLYVTSKNLKLLPKEIEAFSLANAFYFFPNSATYSMLSSDEFTLFNKQNEGVILNAPNKVYNIVQNIAFTSVEHPSGYGDWDFYFQIVPSGNFKNTHLQYKGDENYPEMNIDLMSFSGSFDFKPGVHTVLGNYFMWLGLGGELTFLKAEGENITDISPILSYGVGQTTFMKKKLFVTLAASSQISLGKDYGIPEIYPEINASGFSRFSIALGLFLPEFRSKARSLFK